MDTPFLTQIQLFAFDLTPRGWLPCEGQTLLIKSNEALYSLLGNRFGGAPNQSFQLPDLRDKAPKGLRYYIAIQGLYPQRD